MRAIPRVSVTDTVVNEIKNMIETGQLQPGEKLPTENEMCESMQVSRTCVREAIRVLQALGMVEIQPGKGSFVSQTPIDSRDRWYESSGLTMNDFIEVRMAIETVSTKLAIEKATKKQIEKLGKVLELFLKANDEHKTAALIKYDEMFHSEIVNITGNKLLINLNKQLVVANRVYRCESFMAEDVYTNAVVPHRKIYECFLNGDAEQGQIEMQKHLEITRQDMLYLMEKEEKKEKKQREDGED